MVTFIFSDSFIPGVTLCVSERQYMVFQGFPQVAQGTLVSILTMDTIR